MALAPTLQRYLDQRVIYDVIAHPPTLSSTRTAEVCHISGKALAKGVVLRLDRGYMLAVLPASRHINLDKLKAQLGEDVRLASEDEAVRLFSDCSRGAVPAVGDCYALEVIIDDRVEDQPEIYMEGGDHATLVHMEHGQFARLTGEALHGSFTTHN
jgi:Ala-tRNA(Pro) deacylase